MENNQNFFDSQFDLKFNDKHLDIQYVYINLFEMTKSQCFTNFFGNPHA